MQERSGIVESRGKPVTLIGNELKVGDKAPDFETLDINLKPIRLSSYKGKVVVLSTVMSLDTQVCDLETKQFSKEAKSLGDDVVFITVSMDLPFAQKRWADEAGADDVLLASDHRSASLGTAYGVLIKEFRLLARTVFVIDKGGKIRYIQFVKETSMEPDYDEVLGAVQELI